MLSVRFPITFFSRAVWCSEREDFPMQGSYLLPVLDHYVYFLLLGIWDNKVSAGCFLMEPFFIIVILFFSAKNGEESITFFLWCLVFFGCYLYSM